MGYVSLTRHLEVAPEVAFDYVTQVDRLPRWLTLLTDVRAIGEAVTRFTEQIQGFGEPAFSVGQLDRILRRQAG